jgi:hypothetical protein
VSFRISRSVGREQGRGWFSFKECGESLNQVGKDGATLEGKRTNHGPHPLTIALAILSARALGNASVLHHKADGLLGRIVGRIDSGSGDERELLFTIAPETVGHCFDDAELGQGPADPFHRR